MTGDSRRLNGIASEQLHVRLGRVDSPGSDMKASSFIHMHASCAVLWPFSILKIYIFFVGTRLFKINSVTSLSFFKRVLNVENHVLNFSIKFF